MGNIVLLDDLTINKIAAGEVIERPASAVKEMVENSIDAGANNITVEIKNGGISYIKITDNGKGIMPDDLEIAFERHATSKIRNADDLKTVKSMGFRGEALASIAAIANVEMVSKTENQDTGYKITVEAGEVLNKQEVGCPTGTSITVRNVFFNTPVRYKFLKKDFTESGYIEDVITRIAISNPNVAIKLINSGKTVIQTNGNGDLKTVIYSIYGKDIAQGVLPVNYEYEDIRVEGVVGKPEISRSNRSNQIFFVNKRYVKDKILSSATEKAYKGLLSMGKFAFVILNVTMDPAKVDVNVHPAKLEVRFAEENKVFKAIYHSIKDTLLKNQIINEDAKDETNNQNKFENIVKTPKISSDNNDTFNFGNGGPINTADILKKLQELKDNLTKEVENGKIENSNKQINKETYDTNNTKLELNSEKNDNKESEYLINKSESNQKLNSEKIEDEKSEYIIDKSESNYKEDYADAIDPIIQEPEEKEDKLDFYNKENNIDKFDNNKYDIEDKKETNPFILKNKEEINQYNLESRGEAQNSNLENQKSQEEAQNSNLENQKSQEKAQNSNLENQESQEGVQYNNLENKEIQENAQNNNILEDQNIQEETNQNDKEKENTKNGIEGENQETEELDFDEMYQKLFGVKPIGDSNNIEENSIRDNSNFIKDLTKNNSRINTNSINDNNNDFEQNSTKNNIEFGVNQIENHNNYTENSTIESNEFSEKISNNNQKNISNISIFENEKQQEIDGIYKFIGIAFDKYIIININNSLCMVDYNLANRKLIFDELNSNYIQNNRNSQILFLPDIVTLSKKQMSVYSENKEMLEREGFKLEPFGDDNTMKLTEVPSKCFKLDTKELLLDILDQISSIAITDTELKEKKSLELMASKLEIATREDLNEDNSKKLIKKLIEKNILYEKLNEKPISFIMTKYEIERKFARK